MTKTKTLIAILITAIVGSITFFITAPKIKAKRHSKTTVDRGTDNRDDLFI